MPGMNKIWKISHQSELSVRLICDGRTACGLSCKTSISANM